MVGQEARLHMALTHHRAPPTEEGDSVFFSFLSTTTKQEKGE